jgi:hypothetical protein
MLMFVEMQFFKDEIYVFQMTKFCQGVGTSVMSASVEAGTIKVHIVTTTGSVVVVLKIGVHECNGVPRIAHSFLRCCFASSEDVLLPHIEQGISERAQTFDWCN